MKDTYIEDFAKIKSSNLSSGCKIYDYADLKLSVCEPDVTIGNHSTVYESILNYGVSINRRNYIYRSTIGRFSYTGINSFIFSCSIGAFCSISWNVSIGGSNHNLDRVTTSPLWRFKKMQQSSEHYNDELLERLNSIPPLTIGNDVWIGTNAVVLRDINIGDGAVIGAGAVVTRDVEPYTIVAGVPAKPIRKRFDDKIIAALLDIQWWNWPADVIQKNIDIIYKKKVDMSVIEQLMAIKKGLG